MIEKPILTLDGAGPTLILELVSPQTYYRREVVGDNLNTFLLKEIDAFVKDLGVSLGEIGAIAVNQGPGSYSRLRVVLTWAKTATYLLKIPLWGFDGFTLAETFLQRITATPGRSSSEERFFSRFSPQLKKEISSLPLRVFLYPVTRNRFFVSRYFQGKRIGKIISLDQREGVVPFDERVLFGEEEGSREVLQNQSRQQKRILFLVREGMEFWVGDNPERVFSLPEELSKGWNGTGGAPYPSIYPCVLESGREKSFEADQDSPFTVNPRYFREFGE